MSTIPFYSSPLYVTLNPMVIEPVEPAPSPLGVYRSIRSGGRGFILSVEDGCQRYTVVGSAPSEWVEVARDGTARVNGRKIGSVEPFGFLSEFADSRLPMEKPTGLPPFVAGLVGFFAYELNRLIEPSLKKKSRSIKEDELSTLPALSAGLYRTTYIYHHNSGRGLIFSLDGRGAVAAFKALIVSSPEPPDDAFVADPDATTSSFTEKSYIDAIERALHYIARGDIYQINLSQRLRIPATGDGLTLYSGLLAGGRARFSAFMDFTDFQLISCSPERLLRVKDGVAEIEPIKGTRPRGKDPESDLRLMEELRNDTKEGAEHLMIVDLVRNDLGRLALAGSVEVAEFKRIETLPNLHHLVSTVRATLPSGVSALKALEASFPGGSVTGTPKIRAMEIIAELEPLPRGIYTGGFGWLDISGNMDIAMAIRTAIYREPYLYLHVGGGIVADSKPEAEYKETLLKAEQFLNTLSERKIWIERS